MPAFFMAENSALATEKFIRVETTGLGEHNRSGVCEKMVADLVSRWRCSKTIRGKDVWKIGKKIGDTLWGGEKSGRRERECGGEDVRHKKGEELLKTFYLAMSNRRL